MKKHLNTLFVTTQGAYLSKEGETVVVKIEKEVRMQLPIHGLESIVCFGNVILSPFLMGFCAEKNVAVSFLTEYGKFLARIVGPVSGNVLLRREQYRKADDLLFSSQMAKYFLIGKIANYRTVLRRAIRDHGDRKENLKIASAENNLTNALKSLERENDLEKIRGIEGEAARNYFGVFDNLIISQKEEYFFKERNKHPPLDKVNCLLSFLYTLIVHDCRSALESVGLDPAVGFLHRDRPGRPGLALDLMEEFRAILGDRTVLSLVNLKQIKGNGFDKSESGAVLLNDKTRKTVLVNYQERKKDVLEHPFINEKATIGSLFHVQALLLARHIRGDLDGYPAFIWK